LAAAFAASSRVLRLSNGPTVALDVADELPVYVDLVQVAAAVAQVVERASLNRSARCAQALWFARMRSERAEAGIPTGVAVAALGRLCLTLFARVPRLADW